MKNKVPFLEMKGITKSFPGVKALDNINLSVYRGRFLHLWVKMVQENLLL